MAMAAAASTKKHHRQSYSFLSSSKDLQRDSFPIGTSDYEFTKLDIWNSGNSASSAVETCRPTSQARSKSCGGGGGMSASLPVNVPDWSKILKKDYRDRSKWDDVAEDDEEDEDGGKGWIPPHEYLARNRMASLSVHEGVGRTLKGRDLNRVRNAIWEKIGFQD